MRSQRKYYLIAILFIIIVLGCSGLFIHRNKQTTTLKQAINIAFKEARNWADDPELIQIISTDAEDNTPDIRGEDGKRNSWNVFFTSKKKGMQYNVFVINGKAKYNNEIQMPVYETIDIDNNILLDSSDAEQIAKDIGLKPIPQNEGWAIGYQYALQFVSASSAPPFLAMLIYGKLNGYFSYVVIDPETGNIITIMQQVGYDEDGRAIWKEKTELISQSD